MNPGFPLCEKCRTEGLTTLAAYVYQEEQTGLDGPGMGDPDYWPEPFEGASALCETHFALLPAERRLAYTHVNLCEA